MMCEADLTQCLLSVNEHSAIHPTATQHIDLGQDLADDGDYFGLVEPSSLVVVRTYSGESDAKLLENIKPRFIIMYDPDPMFVRCIEVYKACNPGKQVRVYFTVYDNSVEEQLYLSALRREKDAFTKLIKDKSVVYFSVWLKQYVRKVLHFYSRPTNNILHLYN